MAFTNLAVFGGAFFTPILVGKITREIGWPWTFYFVAIFCGVCLPAIVFFCPETAYRRDAVLNLDLRASEDEAQHGDATAHEKEALGAGHSDANGESGRAVEVTKAGNPWTQPKATFSQSLALFNGRKTEESFWKLLLRPLVLFLQPAFVWACLIQGTLIGWTVFIGVILARYFIANPLWWSEVQTGYAYTAAFVGAILGFAIAGALSDWSARLMTKWNRGVYEPEFRIVLVIPQLILGCAGLYGWGMGIDGLLYKGYHYIVPLVFFALEVAGMVIGAVASSLYIVDAYREFPSVELHLRYLLTRALGDLSIEAFTCMIVFKNLFSFALTLKAFEWVVSNRQIVYLFNVVGSVQVGICLLSVPMCKPRALFRFPMNSTC